MKASELIKELQMLIEKNGDLECMVQDISDDNHDEVSVHSVCIFCDEKNKAQHFLIADKETTLSYME